jgi:hypothetical protein
MSQTHFHTAPTKNSGLIRHTFCFLYLDRCWYYMKYFVRKSLHYNYHQQHFRFKINTCFNTYRSCVMIFLFCWPEAHGPKQSLKVCMQNVRWYNHPKFWKTNKLLVLMKSNVSFYERLSTHCFITIPVLWYFKSIIKC